MLQAIEEECYTILLKVEQKQVTSSELLVKIKLNKCRGRGRELNKATKEWKTKRPFSFLNQI